MSSLGLIIFSPIFFVVAVLVKLNDSGPVFYRGIRVGKDFGSFRIFKFRTMVVDAENRGGPSTADNDPRITKIGKFLRKTKSDELPQLLNVLAGEMSIVGPRPEIPDEVATYTEEQKRILSIRPGITDYASLWNVDEGAVLMGSTDPHKTYREKIKPTKLRLALKYVDEQSFWIDIKIIFLTIKKIIWG